MQVGTVGHRPRSCSTRPRGDGREGAPSHPDRCTPTPSCLCGLVVNYQGEQHDLRRVHLSSPGQRAQTPAGRRLDSWHSMHSASWPQLDRRPRGFSACGTGRPRRQGDHAAKCT